jgi:hypothetical protein
MSNSLRALGAAATDSQLYTLGSSLQTAGEYKSL